MPVAAAAPLRSRSRHSHNRHRRLYNGKRRASPLQPRVYPPRAPAQGAASAGGHKAGVSGQYQGRRSRKPRQVLILGPEDIIRGTTRANHRDQADSKCTHFCLIDSKRLESKLQPSLTRACALGSRLPLQASDSPYFYHEFRLLSSLNRAGVRDSR